ncbi:hypothetical protein BsWGS_11666 [Bradybaena similaris]
MAVIVLLLAQEHFLKYKVQCREEERHTAIPVVVPYNGQWKSKLHNISKRVVTAKLGEPVLSSAKPTRQVRRFASRRQDQGIPISTNISRVRRFAYEDTHEWPKTDSLDYDFDEKGETEDLALWEKIGRNWQACIARGIFMFAGGAMLLMILACCCTICCRCGCYSMKRSCIPCKPCLDAMGSVIEDPMYKRAKELAALMGLKLDYETYMKIKDRFEMQGSGGYNPLGLPHMG